MITRPTVAAHLRALGALLVLLAPIWAGAQERCTLSVGWEPYRPFSYQDQDGTATGVDLELMKLLGREIGCTVTFKQLPWTRHLLELEAGLVDVATSVRKNPEREGYGWFSDPYRENRVAIYVRRGEAGRYTLDSLAAIAKTGFKLGIVDGYYYGAEFEALLKDPAFARQVESTVDNATNIRKLIYGRLDGVLAEDLDVLQAEARALGLYERLESYPLAIPGSQFHLLFSKKSVAPATVAAVNASLAGIKADGRLQQLLERFIHNAQDR